jgi:hypothetical protein
MKALIINFNRLTLTINTADWCASHGLEPIIIDNASDYLPLLDYYNYTPYQVIRLENNYGHRVLWDYPLWEILGIKERFVYTDPDLDYTGIPDDFLRVLNEGLDKYPVDKCGFSLEINDLPDNKANRELIIWENRFWRKALSDVYFDAGIDTTFALYRYPPKEFSCTAIRTNRPYTARHLPWYFTDYSLLPDDENYYYTTARVDISSTIKRQKECGQL